MSSAESEAVELQAGIKASTLDTTLDVLQTLGDEAVLHVGKDGLRVAIVDASNAAIHDPVEVSPSAFETVPKGSFPIGVNLERLQERIGKATNDQVVMLGYKQETRKLHVEYNRYESNLACIDPDSIRSDPDVNELDHPNVFAVEQSDLADALEYAGMSAKVLHINCEPSEDRVVIHGEGDTDADSAVLDTDDFVGDYNLSKETHSMYSYDYLMGKGSKKAGVVREMPSGEIELHTGDEFPLQMYYEYADGDASVRTTLAPRVSEQ